MNRRRWLALAATASLSGQERMPKWRAKTITGEQLSGEGLRGKVVLLQHWATWCGYCRKDEPAVERILEDHAKDGLVVIAINANEPRSTVERYLKDHPRSPKIVLTKDTTLAALFADTGVPAYILVDREGKFAAAQPGAGGLFALREMLKEVGIRK